MIDNPEQATTRMLFDRWAAVYDIQANPLLALEERCLPSLLPDLNGARVLDVGCGTGRWLKRMELLAPSSLAGCDPSVAMLAKARASVSSNTRLYDNPASRLPAKDSSVELLFASFVLSYLDSLETFASECARCITPSGHIIMSDMHPLTASQRSWKRSFTIESEKIDMPASNRSISEILAAFSAHDLVPLHIDTPAFSAQEHHLFEQSERLNEFASLSGVPAIYILTLHRVNRTNSSITAYPPTRKATGTSILRSEETRQSVTEEPRPLRIVNAPWSANAFHWRRAPLDIDNGHISTCDQIDISTLDLASYVLLPGLINAHDHLEFALFPNLGRPATKPPFQSCAEWAHEIHYAHSTVIEQHLQVPLDVRVWFGAIRNLLCGATTVCHHNPLHADFRLPDFPIHTVRNFAWAHSLAFGTDLLESFHASPTDQPFILHACEGTDELSREELHILHHEHLLTERTVLVHGLACSSDEISLLNRQRSSLVLCPTSNQFLFRRTLDMVNILALHKVALGSDSPLTAAGDLLDEVHYLVTKKGLAPSTLYDMVTTQAASILHLTHGEGTLSFGARADLIAVREQAGLIPAEVIAHLTPDKVELVLLAGHVHLASPLIYERLPANARDGLHLMETLLEQQWISRWIRGPLPHLFNLAERVLGLENLRLGNREVRYVPTH
jgi:cytosine/adenosine deaminase-related metal-dependent hydrolase/ubiquinone/menaquinone biosynthesis C-methylase UbiE